MSIAIKICGIKTEQAVEAAARAGATHLGFVFFAASPRYIEPSHAYELSTLAPVLRRVALTVDADNRALDEIVGTAHPQMLQLHGAETPERVREIKARYRLPVIKAIAIAEADDVKGAHAYEGVADFLLFDAKPATLPGGNGLAFDWALIARETWRAPWLLSGGLNPDNVAEAIATTRTRGVDVSSGVEKSRGEKDPHLIEKFVAAARAALAKQNK